MIDLKETKHWKKKLPKDCAPAYANNFVAEFEEIYIYPLIKNMSMLYLRYIYDIFMIWKGYYDDLTNVLHKINKHIPTIKSDFVISKETISFLDTKAFKYKIWNIQTTVYHKETEEKPSIQLSIKAFRTYSESRPLLGRTNECKI